MNVYPPGQCTWWVADQYPWIAALGNLGNASNWASAAKARGLKVSWVPAVGTVLVLQPGVDGGASSFGHVACVVGVTAASVTVTQMDVPIGNPNESTGTYALGPGVSFIYPPVVVEDDETMSVKATRADGTIDYFVVNPDGSAEHIYLGTSNYREKLAGSWAQPVMAAWINGSLHFRGIGWEGGPLASAGGGLSGTVFEVVLPAGGSWSQPSVVV